ncbi:recombinase family protein [Myxococcus stipitatus]|uniref:recombinase family protein n=1 Tax=Myxococcus stipitatus TaxID=83455 RepID=UPI001F3B3889|nr:recombinase family protein [Myxococcus stipitatus]MCE9674094.1 recombinase family protein [Myxococcus stipitatus]
MFGRLGVRAACYLRVSRGSQTVDNQRAPLERVVVARGWTPVWYEETVSGAAGRRPVYEQMMRDAQSGHVSVVVVAALDRLGRSMSQLVTAIEQLHSWGASVVALREGLDTASAGVVRTMLVGVFAALADAERQYISERTRAGLARARAQGTKSGRPIGRPRKYVDQVRAGAKLLAVGDASMRDVARRVGVPLTTLRDHLARERAAREEAERAARDAVGRMAAAADRARKP